MSVSASGKPARHQPYTDEQWARIEALGHAVDADLAEGGIAPHDGRRAHLRLDRRSRRRRVEHKHALGLQKRLAAACSTPQDAMPRDLARFRAGQVVPQKSSSRAGHRPASSAATDSPSGAIRPDLHDESAPMAS
ncbi:MAG: hypothetical protein R3F14_02535 [Polyangiaceae bacterium]